MTVATYLLLQSDEQEREFLRISVGSERNFTVPGTVIFAVGSVLTVQCANSRKCIGLVKVKQCILRETSSTVYYEKVADISDPRAASILYGILLIGDSQSGGANPGAYVPGVATPKQDAAEYYQDRKHRREKYRNHDDDDADSGITQDDVRRLFGL